MAGINEYTGKSLSVELGAAQLTQIAELTDGANIKPFVETVLPLAEARKAHELSQSGRTEGKIVLRVI